jgi:hypothetical protein
LRTFQRAALNGRHPAFQRGFEFVDGRHGKNWRREKTAHKKSFAMNIPVYTRMAVVTISTRKRNLHEKD